MWWSEGKWSTTAPLLQRLVPSWWDLTGKIGRRGFVGGESLGKHVSGGLLTVSEGESMAITGKAHAIPSLLCLILQAVATTPGCLPAPYNDGHGLH